MRNHYRKNPVGATLDTRKERVRNALSSDTKSLRRRSAALRRRLTAGKIPLPDTLLRRLPLAVCPGRRARQTFLPIPLAALQCRFSNIRSSHPERMVATLARKEQRVPTNANIPERSADARVLDGSTQNSVNLVFLDPVHFPARPATRRDTGPRRYASRSGLHPHL